MEKIIKQFLSEVNKRNQNEPEFMQAVTEVAETVIPHIVTKKIYYGQNILLRMVEPERVVSFRVAWIDDNEEIQVNRGYRIEMNSAIGPYKGGLRFHPSVNMSILKFLAFEQVFKNALTTPIFVLKLLTEQTNLSIRLLITFLLKHHFRSLQILPYQLSK